MEVVCPICNALQSILISCPSCTGRMEDGGILEDYYGPYSPYMDWPALQQTSSEGQCVHLLYCPACHYDTRVAWELILV
ncbi:MAG TPA: hypothetical protein DCP36_05785 [Sporomusaceae bacterium]|nr:hypothetical protein [Sporomusaceae bacterium]